MNVIFRLLKAVLMLQLDFIAWFSPQKLCCFSDFIVLF